MQDPSLGKVIDNQGRPSRELGNDKGNMETDRTRQWFNPAFQNFINIEIIINDFPRS